MKRVLLLHLSWLLAAGLALAACGDRFSPPPLPDLAKNPYDFAVRVPPYDMAGLSEGDMTAINHD